MNAQPLEFLVVRDAATIQHLAKVQGFIAQASAIVFIVADPKASTYWLEDASAAAENMLLAIAALGYASTWVEGTLLRREDWAKELLGVPAACSALAGDAPAGPAPRPAAQAPLTGGPRGPTALVTGICILVC